MKDPMDVIGAIIILIIITSILMATGVLDEHMREEENCKIIIKK